MLQLKQPDLVLIPDKKVLKAEEYAAYVETQAILKEAGAKAESIIQEAKLAFEEEKKRGYNEGIEAGKEEIARIMMDFATKSVENFSRMEEDMVRLVSQALRRILGEIDAKELITNVVKNALKVVRNQKQVIIKVAAADVAAVREKLSEILGDTSGSAYVDVVADARLKNGSCLLETEIGVVDASIEVQLAAIEKSMLKALKVS